MCLFEACITCRFVYVLCFHVPHVFCAGFRVACAGLSLCYVSFCADTLGQAGGRIRERSVGRSVGQHQVECLGPQKILNYL